MHVQNHERVQNFCFYPFRKKLKENPGAHLFENAPNIMLNDLCLAHWYQVMGIYLFFPQIIVNRTPDKDPVRRWSETNGKLNVVLLGEDGLADELANEIKVSLPQLYPYPHLLSQPPPSPPPPPPPHTPKSWYCVQTFKIIWWISYYSKI